MKPRIIECLDSYNRMRAAGEPLMTSAELARRMGRSAGAVSYWTAGKRAMTVEDAYKIAKILGCSVDDLFTPFVPQDVIDERAS